MITTVYDLVKECCEEEGITIRTLERTVGLGNGLVKSWVDGSPRMKSIQKVAEYFGKPIEYFVPRE